MREEAFLVMKRTVSAKASVRCIAMWCIRRIATITNVHFPIRSRRKNSKNDYTYVPSMRLNFIVLLVAAALAASVNAFSVATESKMINPVVRVDRALMDGQRDVETKRSLRTEKSSEEEDDYDEERTVVSNAMLKLKNVYNLGAASKIVTPRNKLPEHVLEKQQQYLHDNFMKFKLDKAGNGLFNSPRLEKWVNLRKSTT